MTKLAKDVFCGPYKLLIDSSNFSSIQQPQKEFKFKLVEQGIPQDIDYRLTVIVSCQPSSTILKPEAGICVKLSALEVEEFKEPPTTLQTRLVSVKASLNNGPQHLVKQLSTVPETWSSTFPDSLAPNHGKSWSLEVKLWLRFDNSSEKKALDDFTSLFLKQTHCDIHFKLLDGKRIGAHVIVLISRSPLFATMHEHEMRHTERKDIRVIDCEPVIFRQILQFLYAGRLPNLLSETTAKELFLVAHKYQVEDLALECLGFLQERIRRDNVLGLLIWSEVHSVAQLRENSMEFITKHSDHFRKLINSDEWRSLAERHPHLYSTAVHRINPITNTF